MGLVTNCRTYPLQWAPNLNWSRDIGEVSMKETSVHSTSTTEWPSLNSSHMKLLLSTGQSLFFTPSGLWSTGIAGMNGAVKGYNLVHATSELERKMSTAWEQRSSVTVPSTLPVWSWLGQRWNLFRYTIVPGLLVWCMQLIYILPPAPFIIAH